MVSSCLFLVSLQLAFVVRASPASSRVGPLCVCVSAGTADCAVAVVVAVRVLTRCALPAVCLCIVRLVHACVCVWAVPAVQHRVRQRAGAGVRGPGVRGVHCGHHPRHGQGRRAVPHGAVRGVQPHPQRRQHHPGCALGHHRWHFGGCVNGEVGRWWPRRRCPELPSPHHAVWVRVFAQPRRARSRTPAPTRSHGPLRQLARGYVSPPPLFFARHGFQRRKYRGATTGGR
jgi:hypothetical protein